MESLEQITEKAALLDEKARAQLASHMLRSLPPLQDPISDEDVQRRVQEAEHNPDCILSSEPFFAGIDRAAGCFHTTDVESL